ncbi:hypothetical protein [Hamadaea tsunoensis]|uniref:hypothetical protein n=1 Tax=Hamadaea tsunoensis TaxID=53368 RepID=UPI0004140F50|nr:hypothetical protein [Hamadaea tsunoensis]
MGFAEDLMGKAAEIEKQAFEIGFGEMGGEMDFGFLPFVDHNHNWDGFMANVQGVAGLFAPFTAMPTDDHFEAAMAELRSAMQTLSPGDMMNDPMGGGVGVPANPYLTMSEVHDLMHVWTGAAADDFQKHFVAPFPAYSHNQFMLATVLHSGLAAQQVLWNTARTDIMKVADNTLEALNCIKHADHQRTSMQWTILGAVVATISAPEGGAAIVFYTGLSSAFSLAGAKEGQMKDKEPTGSVDGDTAAAVLRSMKEAIDTTKAQVAAGDQKIAEVMGQALEAARTQREHFIAPRPDLDQATPATVMSQTFLGKPL